MPTLVLLTLLLVCVFAPPLIASDWPQFRGPNGAGVYVGRPLPTELTPGGSHTWSVDVPFGRSSPVIVGDRLYLTASEGNRLLTLCFRRGDGQLLWRHELLRTRVEERVESRNDAASPTPAADESGVYVFFPDEGLLALDVNGRERWKLPLGPFRTAYGMASSPILADGLVVQVCDQQRGSFVVAVDSRTGRVRWRTERPDMREGWFTPAVVRASRGPLSVVVPGSARVESLELRTGRRLWALPGSTAENLGVPLIDGDRVYVNVRGFPAPVFPTWEALRTEHDANDDARLSREELRARPTYDEGFSYGDLDRDGYITAAEWHDLRGRGVGNFGLTAISMQADGTGADVAWRVERNLPYVPAPILYQAVIYMVKSGGILTAVDAASGKILKEARAAEALGDYLASPVAGDGKLYVASQEGRIVVVEATPDLRILKVNDLGDEIYGTPALSDGAVFVRTRSRLYSFRAEPSQAAAATLAQSSGWTADPRIVRAHSGKQPEINYDEAAVPPYTLPDPLHGRGGRVRSREEWAGRREELIELFRVHVYGRSPGRPERLRFELSHEDPRAMGGMATLKRITVISGQGDREHRFALTLFLPNSARSPVGLFLLLNNRPATNADPTRKERSGFWPAEEVIERGHAIASLQVSDLAPDDAARFREGVIALFEGSGSGERRGDAWGALAAWAWGASRALDYFETDSRIDPKRVAIVGHSRGGKAALWAGAEDPRFALVIANESGEGGAALTRRIYGETLARITKAFPHWFAGNYRGFAGRESTLPVDQHMLLALIAPRALYVASADEDLWADPRGEFLSLAHASPVFALWGDEPIAPGDMPPLETPLVSGRRGYHVRRGTHNLTPYDWQRFMDFADRIRDSTRQPPP